MIWTLQVKSPTILQVMMAPNTQIYIHVRELVKAI